MTIYSGSRYVTEYADGLNYRRHEPDSDYYPTWVKPIFQSYPGTPAVFMLNCRNRSTDEVNFYSEVQR